MWSHCESKGVLYDENEQLIIQNIFCIMWKVVPNNAISTLIVTVYYDSAHAMKMLLKLSEVLL